MRFTLVSWCSYVLRESSGKDICTTPRVHGWAALARSRTRTRTGACECECPQCRSPPSLVRVPGPRRAPLHQHAARRACIMLWLGAYGDRAHSPALSLAHRARRTTDSAESPAPRSYPARTLVTTSVSMQTIVSEVDKTERSRAVQK